MKKVFTILLLTFSLLSFSQKVKIKKEKVFIDDVESYKYIDEGSVSSFSTLNSIEFVSIISTSYDVANPARNMPNGYRFPATIKNYIHTVKFLESGKELTTDLAIRDIIKAIHNSKLVDEQGKIDVEKLDVFINKYNNENLKYKIN